MDPNTPTAKLCAEGMRAESEGRMDDARDLFDRAWSARTDDVDASVAAHYVARHQATPEATLHWNRLAVDHADRVGDDRVREFYPSLYLCLGHSHETLGHRVEAERCYELAAARLDSLPPGWYADIVRNGLTAARARMEAGHV